MSIDARLQSLRRPFLITAVALGLTVGVGGTASADVVTPSTGQPGAPANTCGPDNPATPGNSTNAPGSPFNANGQAGVVYAGNPGTASLANAKSTAAVSQYDAACVRLSH